MYSYLCATRHLLVCLALLLFSGAGPARSDVNKVPNRNQFSETTLDKMFQGSLDKQKIATDYVLQHPDAVQPFDYTYMIKTLWAEGNRSQAAFWFYVFQARSLAWAKADKVGSGAAALRASLNAALGQRINQWVGSDPIAWRDIAARAISYEKKMPVYPSKPNGISEADWQKLVTDSRAEYEAGFSNGFSAILSDEKAYAGQRTAHGLYVGPLKDPGRPLPDSWK
jgi:hypothetical protein